MIRGIVALTYAAVAVLALLKTNVQAQSPYADIYSRPTVSPYLNLLGGGRNELGIITPNYQTLVRPQLEAREIAQQQGQAINNLQQQVRRGQTSGNFAPGRTGHETRFVNYSHYYPGFANLPRR